MNFNIFHAGIEAKKTKRPSIRRSSCSLRKLDEEEVVVELLLVAAEVIVVGKVNVVMRVLPQLPPLADTAMLVVVAVLVAYTSVNILPVPFVESCPISKV